MLPPHSPRILSCCFAAAGLTLIAFSMFDIVSGGREELRENGLYLMLLLASWMIVCVHRPAAVQQGTPAPAAGDDGIRVWVPRRRATGRVSPSASDFRSR